ncbi:PDR/VanB family oxidoreductase [Acetobacter garciniae]|uniref:PDR/VanB family oxidoreductase n=1 Tax=Acetobacter garciniae TaxID=2817435 RepID=UPI002EDA17E4
MTGTDIAAVIVAARLQAGRVLVIDLCARDGAELPAFEAGAHIDVEIEPGLVRQYSLCSDPAERGHYRIAVLRARPSRGGSETLHARFAAGQEIRVGAPRNLFPLAPGAGPVLLMAGGIGITPLLAMAHVLHRRGQPFTLHYCIRSAGDAAFTADIATLPFGHRVQIHASDKAGRFDAAGALAANPGAQVYSCGPQGFMDHIETSARALGFAPAALHREAFGSASASPHAGADGGFEVVLARSGGRSVQVPPGTSIVGALAQAGISVETVCQQGICGTCLCTVLEGTPDHRDSFLSAEEQAANDQIALCCSRATSARLVLDL